MLMNDLTFEESLTKSVSRYSINDIAVLNIKSSLCEAMISLHGGHLLQFKPAGEKEIIWLSDKAIFNSENHIRGGIPVCWPWFGRIANPAHGFARVSQWQLADIQVNDQAVIIKLSLAASEQARATWPHEFSATLTFTLSSVLKTSLEVTNTDRSPWQWSGALHTYFNIADAATTEITGAGSAYLNSLQNNLACESKESLMVNQSIDRVYTNPDEAIFVHDHDNNRVISIKNTGDNAAVIWNPWAEISKDMADMSDNGYKTMVCVEATNFARSLESGSIIQPGESHELITEISILPK